MSSPDADFDPNRYRGYLLVVVRRCWSASLQARYEPEDIVQMVIVEALRCRGQFRGQTPEEYRGWLAAILTHTVRDQEKYLRQKKRDIVRERPIETDVDRSSDAINRLVATGPSPSSDAAREEALICLSNALAQLPADQFTAVSLFHLDGLTLNETAVQMGRTPASVAGLLRRAMKALRCDVGKDFGRGGGLEPEADP